MKILKQFLLKSFTKKRLSINIQAQERQKEEEIAAQEAMEDAAQQEAMENDLMMQNEMEAEIDMAMNDLGDQPD